MGSFEKYALHVPPLGEVADLLQKGLKKAFCEVEVEVVECPDLTEEPFMLSDKGLSGKPRLADVGGVPYLIPLAQDKKYNLDTIAKQMEIPDAFIIGPGAGPRHHLGTNCELVANVKFGEKMNNNTHVAKLREDGSCDLQKLKDCTDFCLLGNLFACEGQPGKVIKVNARKRTGSENFITTMRKILVDHYKDKPVGVGGVFLLKEGKAKLHIMPDYSKTPLCTDEDVDNWLKFFNMSAPLICLGTFVSHDPGLDLRIEHTHCFSNHGEGGHYHIDTTPDDVEYLGYFNIAEFMFRIDRPAVTHSVGRD